MTTKSQREATRRYDKTPKGKAKKARYRSSEYGKRTTSAAQRVWNWNKNYATEQVGYYEFIKDRLLACAACGTTDPGSKKGFCTHHTGSREDGTFKVHGWLCHPCNIAARQGTRTDIVKLRMLADWLEFQGGVG